MNVQQQRSKQHCSQQRSMNYCWLVGCRSVLSSRDPYSGLERLDGISFFGLTFLWQEALFFILLLQLDLWRCCSIFFHRRFVVLLVFLLRLLDHVTSIGGCCRLSSALFLGSVSRLWNSLQQVCSFFDLWCGLWYTPQSTTLVRVTS